MLQQNNIVVPELAIKKQGRDRVSWCKTTILEKKLANL